MSLSYGCNKCSLHIGVLTERMVCDGCRKEYHLNCIQMNQYQLRVCVDFANVLWLCDDCLSSFRKQQTAITNASTVRSDAEHVSHIEHTVSQLQSEVSTLKQSFAELKTMSSGSQTPNRNHFTMPSTSTPESSTNHQRISSVNMNESTQLLMGSKAEPSTRRRKYWMFFTRVAKHVTVDAMSKMITESLQATDPPDVIKLMPRWSNYEDLRYISFKVGVDWKHKERAVMESTWPTGLLFREFVHRGAGYWEP